MKKQFGGSAIVLDRSDINTDEIIPAKYLTEVTKEALKPHILEDLEIEGFDPGAEAVKNARVIVTRENFGCGSSREHAPWVFEVNDVHTVIAESYARIFRQNMFNCGMLAIELPREGIDELVELAKNGELEVDVDLEAQALIARAGDSQKRFGFDISQFDKALVEAGGWVEYADARY